MAEESKDLMIQEDNEHDRNAVWIWNHEKITAAYDQLLIDRNGKKPTLKALSELTGLSVNTVHKHMDSLDREGFAGRNAEQLKRFRMRTAKVLKRLQERAEEGDTQAIKLYMQLVENWSEKQQLDVEHSGEVKTNNQLPVLIQFNVRNGAE